MKVKHSPKVWKIRKSGGLKRFFRLRLYIIPSAVKGRCAIVKAFIVIQKD